MICDFYKSVRLAVRWNGGHKEAANHDDLAKGGPPKRGRATQRDAKLRGVTMSNRNTMLGLSFKNWLKRRQIPNNRVSINQLYSIVGSKQG